MALLHQVLLAVVYTCAMNSAKSPGRLRNSQLKESASWRVVCTPMTNTQPRPKCLTYQTLQEGAPIGKVCPDGLQFQVDVQLCVPISDNYHLGSPTSPPSVARRSLHQARVCWPPQHSQLKGNKCVTKMTSTQEKELEKSKDLEPTLPTTPKIRTPNETVSSHGNGRRNSSAPPAKLATRQTSNQCLNNQEYYAVCSKAAVSELSKVPGPCCCDQGGCTLLQQAKKPCPGNTVYDPSRHRCRINCKQGQQFDKHGRGCQPKTA